MRHIDSVPPFFCVDGPNPPSEGNKQNVCLRRRQFSVDHGAITQHPKLFYMRLLRWLSTQTGIAESVGATGSFFLSLVFEQVAAIPTLYRPSPTAISVARV